MKRKLVIIWTVLTITIILPNFTIAQCPPEGCPEGQVCTIFNECMNLYQFIDEAVIWGAGIIATLCVLMIILAGYQYITSSGNPEGIDKAKKTIEYAIGGLILLAVAYIIISILVPSR